MGCILRVLAELLRSAGKMNLAAALIYWIIIALWLAVLVTVCVAFVRNPRTFGTVRLLLAVLTIDTLRNIVENLYFGLYFGGQYGLFPTAVVGILGNPNYLIIPKALNVVAACAVLGLLVLRWLPLASKERLDAENDIRLKSAALRQEIEERRRLFETSLDLILVIDRKGSLLRVSPSSTATIGYSPSEMIGRRSADFILPEDLGKARHEVGLARRGHQMRNFETRYVHKDGHAVSLAWSGVWSEPEQKYFFFGRDITERKIAEEKLKQLALYDQLTGLPNRVSLHEDLDTLLGDASSRPISVAMFDLEGFKNINDTLGHSIGDRLLKEVAQHFIATAGGSRVYRSGGDEFVVVLADSGDPIKARDAVDRILKGLSKQFEIDGHNLFVAASVGIAIAPNDGSNGEELLGNVDLALYDARAAGGRSCHLFVPALRAKASARRELDTEIRRAYANNEFVLYFQPQVSASDTTIIGAEALIRWHHPVRGVLAPSAFIDALAESAVVLDVGRWILKVACQNAAFWRENGLPTFRIGINLFPAQFRYGTLLDDVERALFESGLPAEALELEITENIALGSDDAMLVALSALRAKGINIAFDDFGTGYASLSYLTKYPLTRIKIDRSFVQRITKQSNAEDTAIVRSIITMARNLKLQVTAEGVETAAQTTFLRSEGCDELQGFFFAKPLPANEFEKLLGSHTVAMTKAS